MTTIMMAKLIGTGVGIGVVSEAISKRKESLKKERESKERIQRRLDEIRTERIIRTEICDIKRRYGMI